ncbi:MAG TPA: redoxin domain-containing protein [Candidatus Koribacter sp.]
MMIRKLAVIAVLLCVAAPAAVCQAHKPSPAAKAAYEEARAPISKGFAGDPKEMSKAVDLLKKAVTLDPDYYDAQQEYIMMYAFAAAPDTLSQDSKKSEAAEPARKKAQKEVEVQYLKLAAEHPDKAVYQWALGWIYEYDNPDKSVEYYKQAVKLDPHCGPALDSLGIAAEEHGDLELSEDYARRAYEAWPDDAHLWRHYVGAYTSVPTQENIEKAKQIVLAGADKFPEEAANMLSYTASRTTDETQAREMYELVQQRFPNGAKGYTLIPLFNLYMKSDRAKALALADSMVKADAKDKQWPQLQSYAKALTDADDLAGKGEFDKAIALLDGVKLPGHHLVDGRWLDIEKAKVLAAQGNNKDAYALLLKAYAATPSDEVHTALNSSGEKLGKSADQIAVEINTARAAAAKPGIPFMLTDYATGKPVSLSDYKGRVVLVNFWYPKCGPCRGEFPYLQMSLEKYKSQGFEILAINGHPPEDSWVMPLVHGWHLGFIPLKGTEDLLKEYKVRGFPENFLYGADGKIYPMPSQVRPTTLREFQLQVEALLQQANAGGNTAAVAK